MSSSTTKSRPDEKNIILITENIALVPPATASGFSSSSSNLTNPSITNPTISGGTINDTAINASVLTSGVIIGQLTMEAAIPYEYYIYKTSGNVTNIKNNSGIIQYSGVDTGTVINSMLSGANSNISIGFQPNSYSGATDIQNNGRSNVAWYGNNAQFGMKIKINSSGGVLRAGNNVFNSFIMSGSGAGFVFDNVFTPVLQNCRLEGCTTGVSIESSNRYTELWELHNVNFNNCEKSLVFETPTGAGNGSYINGFIGKVTFNIEAAYDKPYTFIEVKEGSMIDESKIIDTRFWFNAKSGIGVHMQSGSTAARTMWFKPYFENFATASGFNTAIQIETGPALYFYGRPVFAGAGSWDKEIIMSGASTPMLGINSVWRQTTSVTVGTDDVYGASATVISTTLDDFEGMPNMYVIVGGTFSSETVSVEITANAMHVGAATQSATITKTFRFTGTFPLNLSEYFTLAPNNYRYIIKNFTARAKTNKASSTSVTVSVGALNGGSSQNSTILTSGFQWLGLLSSGESLVDGAGTVMPTPQGYLRVTISGREMFMPYFISG